MLRIKSLSKKYGHRKIFEDFNLVVQDGAFVSIMGSNGTGKTTLFNIIAGITKPDKGVVQHNSDLSLSYMPQDNDESLYPWFSAWENIAMPLRFLGCPKKERLNIVRNFIQKYDVKLPLMSYPYQLSGGQKRLTLLLRCIINKQQLILLDEPFSSLDLPASRGIQRILIKIWQEYHPTIIYTSHNIEDSIFLSNKIIVLSHDPIRIVFNTENTLSYPRKVDVIESQKFNKLYMQLDNAISNL